MGRAACRYANRRASTFKDQSDNTSGSHSSLHVFVVDEDGDAVPG